MRSIDDRAEIRGLFLRFPLDDCLLMIEPLVWSTGALGGLTSAWDKMEPFPAETLALWDNVSRAPFVACDSMPNSINQTHSVFL
jgi:hypothetical protein